MAAAKIRIDQAAHPTQKIGVAGRSRDDIVVSQPVTLRNDDDTGVRSWRWEIVDQPDLGSPDVLSNPTSAVTTFTPTETGGTYLIQLTVNEGNQGEVDRRVIAIRDGQGLRYPAASEDQEANWIDASTGAENDRGWWPDLKLILAAVVSGDETLEETLDLGDVMRHGQEIIGEEDGDSGDGGDVNFKGGGVTGAGKHGGDINQTGGVPGAGTGAGAGGNAGDINAVGTTGGAGGATGDGGEGTDINAIAGGGGAGGATSGDGGGGGDHGSIAGAGGDATTSGDGGGGGVHFSIAGAGGDAAGTGAGGTGGSNVSAGGDGGDSVGTATGPDGGAYLGVGGDGGDGGSGGGDGGDGADGVVGGGDGGDGGSGGSGGAGGRGGDGITAGGDGGDGFGAGDDAGRGGDGVVTSGAGGSGSEAAPAGEVLLQIAAATKWKVDTQGNLQPISDNGEDIGTAPGAGERRVAKIYAVEYYGAAEVSWKPQEAELPSSNPASVIERNINPVIVFASGDICYLSKFWPSRYNGGDIKVTVIWAADTATSGDCRWNVSIERQEQNGHDLDNTAFDTATSATQTTYATAGTLRYTEITITAPTNTDALAAGEMFRLKLERGGTGDTMSGNAHVRGVSALEVA